MEFEWNIQKNKQNIEKHGISFVHAVRIFDRPSLTFLDARRDYSETRYVTIGKIDDLIYLVVYTIRNNCYRLISARRASRDERQKYREIYPR
jgi:uncharacterized DUF497 family protein